MDPLSQVIGLFKPSELTWGVKTMCEPWGIRFPAVEAVVFGQMIEGRCALERTGEPVLELRPGDFIMMACPSNWILRSGPDVEPIDLKAMHADPIGLAADDPATPATRFLAGHFLFAAPNADLVAGLLMSLVHIRAADVASERLGLLLRLLSDEAAEDRPGRSLALDRLLEVILVEALRHASSLASGVRPGLIAGLADPRIGRALRALHGDSRRAWTVAELAEAAGMSRAGFAARFVERVGASPIAYLSAWRMSLAKAALISSKRPLIEIAEVAGYASVSAFSTAFSRATGQSPTVYGRVRSA